MFKPSRNIYICDVYMIYMVQAMINVTEHVNRVLNIVKAKYGLKDKSEAINIVVAEYEENLLEPELRPAYRDKLSKIIKGKHFSRKEFERLVG